MSKRSSDATRNTILGAVAAVSAAALGYVVFRIAQGGSSGERSRVDTTTTTTHVAPEDNATKEQPQPTDEQPPQEPTAVVEEATTQQDNDRPLEPEATQPIEEPTPELTAEERVELLLSAVEACTTKEELDVLVANSQDFLVVCSFAPEEGISVIDLLKKVSIAKKTVAAGGVFVFWISDWCSLANGAFSESTEQIDAASQLCVEACQACGVHPDHVKFCRASTESAQDAKKYWTLLLDIARRFPVSRVNRCVQTMGSNTALLAGQIVLPLLQCTDLIFSQGQASQVGLDKHKVSLLAREYCDVAGVSPKPVILASHVPLRLDLAQSNFVSLEDSEAETQKKIFAADCTAQDGQANPCLELVKHFVFRDAGSVFETNSGSFSKFSDVEAAFLSGSLSQDSLKEGLANTLNTAMKPIRESPTTKEAAEQFQLAKEAEPESVPYLQMIDRETDTCVVFAPFASGPLSLGTLMNTLLLLRVNLFSRKVVLWLPDLASFARGCLNGNQQEIEAWYSKFTAGLHALSPLEMDHVTIIQQSTAAFSDPASYWSSVLAVGRSLELSRVAPESSAPVGVALSGLMHVADVMSVSPSRILCIGEECHSHAPAVDYLKSIQNTPDAPRVPLVLDMPGCDIALNNSQILIDDTIEQACKKISEAFCETKNVANCPVLRLGEMCMCARPLSVTVQQKNTELVFTNGSKLRQEFASGTLQPAELKDAVAKIVCEVLEEIRNGKPAQQTAA